MDVNCIYNESCLVTMGKMEDCSVDVVITSPPYNKAGYEGFIRTPSPTDAWSSRNIEYDGQAENDFLVESIYQEQQIEVLDEIQRILKPNGSCFYNHKVRVAQHKASHPIEWLIKSNLVFRQQIIWNRKSSPAVSPIRYLPTTELIFWLTKQAIQPNFNRNKDCLFGGEVWDIVPRKNPNHPAPFPIEIPFNILSCIENSESLVVYDPYCGTGTVLQAAKLLGMSYIGSEIVKKYCIFAEQQLNQLLF